MAGRKGISQAGSRRERHVRLDGNSPALYSLNAAARKNAGGGVSATASLAACHCQRHSSALCLDLKWADRQESLSGSGGDTRVLQHEVMLWMQHAARVGDGNGGGQAAGTVGPQRGDLMLRQHVGEEGAFGTLMIETQGGEQRAAIFGKVQDAKRGFPIDVQLDGGAPIAAEE